MESARAPNIQVLHHLRYFHVVPEFEVRAKLQGLRHGDVTPCLKHHHSNWASRESITNDQFCDDTGRNVGMRPCG